MSYLTVQTTNLNFRFDNLSKEFILGVYYVNSCYLNSTPIGLNAILNTDANLDIISILLRCVSIDLPIKDIQDIKAYNANIKKLSSRIPNVMRYTMIDSVPKDPILADFNNIEFLNGVYTSMRWVPDRKFESRIVSVHNNAQLCHQYIKHDIKVDHSRIRNMMLDLNLVINDLINIIIGYYSNTCRYYELYESNKKYMHCDTLCEIGEDLCKICKSSINGDVYNESPFKVSVRLEVAN